MSRVDRRPRSLSTLLAGCLAGCLGLSIGSSISVFPFFASSSFSPRATAQQGTQAERPPPEFAEGG